MEDKINYKSHCLIEASAGTGKTWTIIDTYTKLLFEEKAPIDKILVVTFTEKAVGEVRSRIYEKLLEFRNTQQSKEVGHVINESLKKFTSIPVYTIHGFCQMLLNEYSFETKIPFTSQLTQESQIANAVYEQTLKEYLTELNKTSMPILKTQLGDFLLLMSDYPGVTKDGVLNLKEKSTNATLQLFNHQDLIFLPESMNLRQGCLDWEKDFFSSQSLIPSNELKNNYLEWLSKKKKKKHDEFENLFLILKTFEIELTKRLFEKINQEKREASLLSYSDMLNLVNKACQENHSFTEAVSARFPWAIVDEFQDTDQTQWSIFRTLFLKENNHLILVGDPKQAIYGFRGADIYAYLQAKEVFQKLQKEKKASIVDLNINYRTDKRLIENQNQIFKHPLWFGNTGHISYLDVEATPHENLKVYSKTLPTDRTCLNLISLTKTEEKVPINTAKSRLFSFICDEISFLVSSKAKLIENGIERKYEYKDIVILSRNKNDAIAIKKHLDKNKIPTSFYKEQGLFQKPQAFEFLLILEAIQKPQKEELSSRLAFTRWNSLLVDKEISLKNTLHELNSLASVDRWSEVFSTLLSHRYLVNDFTNIKEDQTIYSQIESELIHITMNENYDLAQTISHLRNLILNNDSLPDELSLIQNEIENNKVQIMTVHASKGLEFPVVFIAGGLTQKAPSAGNFYKFHKDVGGHKKLHIDFSKSSEFKSLHDDEHLEEEKRLLYVACTRASIHLYLPNYKATRGPGPISTFLHSILNEKDIFKNPKEVTHIIYSEHKGKKQTKNVSTLHDSNIIGNQKKIVFPSLVGRRTYLESFTSLHSRHSKNSFSNEVDNENNFIPTPIGQELSTLNKHLRGVMAGNLFHEILENITFFQPTPNSEVFVFSMLSKADQDVITQAFLQNGFGELLNDDTLKQPLLDGVCHIISQTLHTSLPLPDNKSFCLSMLSSKQRLHEMDFMFLNMELERDEQRFLNGSIDLVFIHKKRYYIIDWKSNFHPHDYSQNSINQIMDQNEYHLQYLIYTYALNRHLHSTVPNYTYDKNFGGVFYLFLRGLGLDKKDTGAGIFYTKPLEKDLLKLKNRKGEP